MPRDDGRARRMQWEDQWRRHAGPEFQWHLHEPPPELRDLIDRGGLPEGAAMDLGCGSGVATAFLARSFRPTIGLDIAHEAVMESRELAKREEAGASFVVADAPFLPFRPESFALIFDRGCLQAVPRESWLRYFEEAARLLKPGGVLQLLVSRPVRSPPALLSLKGLKSRARSIAQGKGDRRFIPDEVIRRILPRPLETVLLDHFPFTTSDGILRDFTHGVFRKR